MSRNAHSLPRGRQNSNMIFLRVDHNIFDKAFACSDYINWVPGDLMIEALPPCAVSLRAKIEMEKLARNWSIMMRLHISPLVVIPSEQRNVVSLFTFVFELEDDDCALCPGICQQTIIVFVRRVVNR